MSETLFTPGPWSTKRARTPVDGEYDWCIAAEIGGERHVISEAFGRVSPALTPNAEANANLIAAAPDMFAALEQMTSAFGDGITFGLLRQARAALAKARGETT